MLPRKKKGGPTSVRINKQLLGQRAAKVGKKKKGVRPAAVKNLTFIMGERTSATREKTTKGESPHKESKRRRLLASKWIVIKR